MKHRSTIHVEEAEILAHEAHDGGQHVLRLHAPKTAEHARPGSFIHLGCDDALPMRRPLSIMRSGRGAGWIDILYRVFGHGTGLLAQRKPGERLSLLGPIGQPFVAHAERPRPLLLGGGVGIPPMVFLAEELKADRRYQPLVMMGSEVPFPFTARPSQIMVPGIPASVIAAMPLLDDWGIPSRLASLQGYPGCHEGYVTDLARAWLQALDETQRAEVEIFACGPHPMLAATARLAREFDLPCQVSLEEYMACAVGGCAGCTVRIETAQGPAMKRVCVDGPVFDARTVVF
jgi:dihydroorotate dehydrogenase electron transfer subunit